MKKQTKIAIIAGLMLVVIGAAAILYDKLVLDYSPDNMVYTTETGNVAATATNVSNQPSGAATTSAGSEVQQEVTQAPDFTVIDMDGRAVSLHSLAGKPVIVNFWASWCPPCKAEMPDFEAAYKKYGSEIQFMMVNMTDGGRETVETAKKYIADQGYTFPIYFDTEQEAAYTYGVSAIPTTYFINAQGIPVAYAAGAITAAHLEQGIAMMNGE